MNSKLKLELNISVKLVTSYFVNGISK